MSYKINVYNLLSKSNKLALKNEALSIPVLEEALKIVQPNNDIKLEMHVRFRLASAYLFAKRYEDAINSYSWCFEKANEIPNRYEINEDILWKYDILVSHLSEFTSIPLSEIKKVMQDMKKRCLENNVGLKLYYSLKLQLAMQGIYIDKEDINKIYENWLLEPKNKYECCDGCISAETINYYIHIQDYNKALEESEHLIKEISKNEDYMCSNEPNSIYGKLIIAVIKMKNFDLAKEFYAKGYESVDGKREFIHIIACHIIYLALVDIDKGIQTFEKNYSNCYISNTDYEKLYFNLAAYILFSKVEEKNIKQLSLNISKDTPIFVDSEYDVSKLKEYFKEETYNLMNAFDNRNGNDFVSQHIKKIIDINNGGIIKCYISKIKKLIQKVLYIFKK